MSSDIRFIQYTKKLTDIDTEKFLIFFPDIEKDFKSKEELIKKIKTNFEKFKNEISFQKDDDDFFLIREIVMYLEEEKQVKELYSESTYGWNDIIVNMNNLLLKFKSYEHQ